MNILHSIGEFFCKELQRIIDKPLNQIMTGMKKMSDDLIRELQEVKADQAAMMQELGHARDRDAIQHAASADIQTKLDTALAQIAAMPATVDNSVAERLISEIRAVTQDATAQLANLDANVANGTVPTPTDPSGTTQPEPAPTPAPTPVDEPVPTEDTEAPAEDLPAEDLPTEDEPKPVEG